MSQPTLKSGPLVRATFARIGRSRDVAPLDIASTDADDIAAAVHKYARPYLMSRDIEVAVLLDEMVGSIYAGYQTAGQFSLEWLGEDVWL